MVDDVSSFGGTPFIIVHKSANTKRNSLIANEILSLVFITLLPRRPPSTAVILKAMRSTLSKLFLFF